MGEGDSHFHGFWYNDIESVRNCSAQIGKVADAATNVEDEEEASGKLGSLWRSTAKPSVQRFAHQVVHGLAMMVHNIFPSMNPRCKTSSNSTATTNVNQSQSDKSDSGNTGNPVCDGKVESNCKEGGNEKNLEIRRCINKSHILTL